MIKYFKELENPSNYYLELPNLNSNGPLGDIDIKTLPINFFNKYAILFQKIIEYDLLFDTNDKIPQIYLNSIDEELLIPQEMLFYSFISNEIKEDGTPFSKNGINKIYFLKQEYYRRHGKKELTNNDYYNYLLLYDNYDENLYDYFLAIYDYMRFSNQLLGASKWQIYYYLLAAKKMAKFQGKLSPEDERLFDEALKEIINYKIIIPDKKPYNVVKYKLFNEWYITPFNHLYNTLSEAHTPNVFYKILRSCCNGYNFYPHNFLGEAKEILEKGCSYLDFRANTHINCTFPGIYTLDIPYFDLDEVERQLFEYSGSTLKYAYKIQNPKIKTITAGILSALAGIIAFSYY